ncbi:MAG: phosphoribosylanthranilate isomerase [Methanospirillum sp.]|uniref:phosphoribosylanthranilate isomerase n=1 Tax=Methanospirillum sp. TaxID=45200 RepID=UPI00236D40F0|nr:phosphoribosylanthranilate isomerase [Methanospirillum sp.]MDD1727619.1 phosphoribosylanthranilate isomerase [Methanospirillum sp.]
MTRPEDAQLADRAGADAIGVVLFSDSPRSVEPKRAIEIFRAAGPYMGRVCVSHSHSRSEIDEILDLGPTAIQISYPHTCSKDRAVQIIRVVEPGKNLPMPGEADALIIDASQGKGKSFDPVFARNIISSTTLPVILAGGLQPDTVAEAVRLIRPYAIDVASGVEASPGIKDAGKVMSFVQNARLSS